MKSFKYILAFLFSAFIFQACTHYSGDTAATRQAEVGQGEYIVIRFPPGKERLLDSEKEKIKIFKKAVEGRANVNSIKVLAWSDQEYPVEGTPKPSSEEQKLADERGKAVREFLKKDLGSKKDVDVHNMAKQPGVFAQVFKSDDFQMKNSLEAVSAASAEMGIVSDNKGSKAVIVVNYE